MADKPIGKDEVIKKAGGQTAISEKTGIPLKSISNYCLGISPPKLMIKMDTAISMRYTII